VNVFCEAQRIATGSGINVNSKLSVLFILQLVLYSSLHAFLCTLGSIFFEKGEYFALLNINENESIWKMVVIKVWMELISP